MFQHEIVGIWWLINFPITLTILFLRSPYTQFTYASLTFLCHYLIHIYCNFSPFLSFFFFYSHFIHTHLIYCECNNYRSNAEEMEISLRSTLDAIFKLIHYIKLLILYMQNFAIQNKTFFLFISMWCKNLPGIFLCISLHSAARLWDSTYYIILN